MNNWICINFSRNVQESVARGFCYELAQMCYISGMVWALCFWFCTCTIFCPKCWTLSLLQAYNPEPVLPAIGARPDHVEKVLKTRYHDAMTKLQPQGKELDLLIVILPDNNGSLYGMKESSHSAVSNSICLDDDGMIIMALYGM